MTEIYLTLTFDIEPDQEGHKDYLERWPDFKPETIRETLIREAVAAWESEGLVKPGVRVNGWVVE